VISTGGTGIVIGLYEKGAPGKPGTVPRDLSGGDQSLGLPDCLSAIYNATPHPSDPPPSVLDPAYPLWKHKYRVCNQSPSRSNPITQESQRPEI
jgi:hypothetical protein